jgi:transglutaminase-like putative cysteine protease
MHFHARHVTRYRYSSPVFCEPLTIRLQPRTDFRQRLLRFSLDIDPTPSGLSCAIDGEGNDVTTAWFGRQTDELIITTTFEAQTQDVDPFHFLLDPAAKRLPLVPSRDEELFFLLFASSQLRAAEVEELAHELARKAGFDTLKYVLALNEWIHSHHETIVRHEGAAWHPRKTLQEGRGACRDLAVLFVEGCRAMNLPSRFISGYGLRLDDSVDHELHAWAEVYLPGAGWRAFDPSLGLAITQRHLTVAVGRTPEHAAPASGTYRGNAESRMEAEIELVAGPSTSMVQTQSL